MVNLSSLRTFFLAMLLLAPLLQSTNSAVATSGLFLLYALVLAICFISVLYVLLIGRVRVPRAFALVVFCFVALIIWSLLRAEDGYGFELTLNWLALLIFFSALVIWPLSSRELDRLVWVGGIAALLSVFLSILGGGNILGEVERIGRVAWFVSPNFVGSLLIIYAFFVLLGLGSMGKQTRIISGIALAALIIGLAWSASRAAMLTMLLIVVALTISYLSFRKRTFISLVYAGVVSLGLSFLTLHLVLGPQALPQMGNLNWLVLDEYSVQLLGKHFDTGRLDLWAELLVYIEQRPVIGWGAGVTPEALTGNPLSAHNGYLQIWLQLGAVGMLLQIILLAALVLALFKGRNRISRVALAVILGLIVRDMFEVALLQNNTPLTLLTWVIAGIGVSVRGLATHPSRTAPAHGRRKAILEALAR